MIQTEKINVSSMYGQIGQGRNKPTRDTRRRAYSNIGRKCKILLPIKSLIDKEFVILKVDFLGDNILYRVVRNRRTLVVQENQIELI